VKEGKQQERDGDADENTESKKTYFLQCQPTQGSRFTPCQA